MHWLCNYDFKCLYLCCLGLVSQAAVNRFFIGTIVVYAIDAVLGKYKDK